MTTLEIGRLKRKSQEAELTTKASGTVGCSHSLFHSTSNNVTFEFKSLLHNASPQFISPRDPSTIDL